METSLHDNPREEMSPRHFGKLGSCDVLPFVFDLCWLSHDFENALLPVVWNICECQQLTGLFVVLYGQR